MVNSRRRDFDHKKRIVVKVGSSTISHGTGKLNYRRMEHLVRELADLQNQGKEMILVSSGATNAGMAPLNLDQRPRSIREKQALAAVGQGVLMHTYERLFREYGQVVGQVLLTRMDSQDRSKFMHSRNALLTMIDMGIIPIINENDSIAVDDLFTPAYGSFIVELADDAKLPAVSNLVEIGEIGTTTSEYVFKAPARRWTWTLCRKLGSPASNPCSRTVPRARTRARPSRPSTSTRRRRPCTSALPWPSRMW